MCEVYKYLRFREKKDSGERLPSETNGKAALTDLVAEAGADHSSYSLPLSSFPSFSLPISSTFLPFAYPFLTFLPLPSLIFLLPSLSLPLPSFIPSLPYGLPPLSPSRGSEECCKLPQQGPRRNPGLRRVFKTILTPENTSSDKKFSSVFCCRYFLWLRRQVTLTDRMGPRPDCLPGSATSSTSTTAVPPVMTCFLYTVLRMYDSEAAWHRTSCTGAHSDQRLVCEVQPLVLIICVAGGTSAPGPRSNKTET